MMSKTSDKGNEAMTLHIGSLAPAALLAGWMDSLPRPGSSGPVLDLACGLGDNGLYLAANGFDVLLADNDVAKLADARQRAGILGPSVTSRVTVWQVDLESEPDPLPAETFGAILVFRYLHRPLLPNIAQALLPGGVLIYETFTRDQAQLGKPTNPDFLLNPGELKAAFAGFEILHSREGLLENPERHAAQLVARKPS